MIILMDFINFLFLYQMRLDRSYLRLLHFICNDKKLGINYSYLVLVVSLIKKGHGYQVVVVFVSLLIEQRML